MFEGLGVGRADDNGVEIKCGDRVLFHQFTDEYIQTHSQDGWGRDVKLCRHDQRTIEAKEKTIEGSVFYDPETTSFSVKFDEYLLDSGIKIQNLSFLLRKFNKKDRLVVKLGE